MNILGLLRTLRHLRPRQVVYQLYYRLTGRLMHNGARTQVRSTLGTNPVIPPLSADRQLSANALPVRCTEAGFCFLNQTVHFPSFGAIDWNYARLGKLWTYNLNYFEYLRQPDLDPDVGEQLIGSWVTSEDTHKDGWEPYPTSLRLVNWLQFYRTAERPVPARIHSSIRRQYVNLWRKLEYHLGGNHLLENALALALTARYLNDARGQRRADKLLLAELQEQYLPDGGHYERTVMYHLVLLWRQLDVYSWVAMLEGWDNQWEKPPPPPTGALERSDFRPYGDLAAALRVSITNQLAWANAMITPSGRYPHFNDSTDGIAPEWFAVKTYARSLGLQGKPQGPLTSGYYHWGTDRINLWIDAGPIGPDDIPGHAHADSLTFVLSLDGQPLIVDPAISTYEKNERRAYERSTRAHNTVTVGDDLDSSEVWGGFRVGKRARTRIRTTAPHHLLAEHNGFSGTTHQREFKLNPTTERLEVKDLLIGQQREGNLRLHFAPGLVPVLDGSTLSLPNCTISFAGASDLKLFDYKKAVGWNTLENARGVVVSFRKSLIFELEWTAP